MKHDYEVILIGSGFAGTVLASILARHGMKVCLVEASAHPRYAIGESTIPQTSQMISLVARKFDVPELEYLGMGSPKAIQKHITSNCGLKRLFGYAYHELGKEHDPVQAHQFADAFRNENHLFRQDIDAYMAQVAVRYGADLLLQTRIEDFDISDDGVTVRTSTGKTLTAQYLVDGAGFRSPVAAKYDLREDPARFQTQSRCIFTHMIDVKPFEDLVTTHCSNAWSGGTLHHIFDGGWIWIIPFNNQESSTNDLISVGLTLDPRRFPRPDDQTGEEEFFSFIREHLPSAAPQFEKARAMQPWVSTQRLQYSSRRSVGTRWALLNHASGFVDALFSRGLINTVEVVRALAETLLQAHEDGDYSDERFADLEDVHRRGFDFADRIVNASFLSWRDFRVWDCMVRIWATGMGTTGSNLGSYLILKDRAPFERAKDPLFSEFEEAGFRRFFEQSEAVIHAFGRGEVTAEQAEASLRKIHRDYDFRMKVSDGSHCVEWALKNPGTRDWWVGSDVCRERWEAKEHDPWLKDLPLG